MGSVASKITDVKAPISIPPRTPPGTIATLPLADVHVQLASAARIAANAVSNALFVLAKQKKRATQEQQDEEEDEEEEE